MSKTGNSYFTFCNLTDKRRKCVFIKLAVSAQFMWSPVNNCLPAHFQMHVKILEIRSIIFSRRGHSSDALEMGNQENVAIRSLGLTRKSPQAGLPSFTTSQAFCLFSINMTGLRVNEKNSTHLTGTLPFSFRK